MEAPLSPKDTLRQTVLRRLKDLGPDETRRLGTVMSDRLSAWAPGQGFTEVLATLPLPGEPDLTPFLRDWIARGHRVALAWTGPGRTLGFRYVASLEGPWEPRPYGLREPPAAAPGWDPGARTLVLVPGLAFARVPGRGVLRLGRGAGYYDRWLATHRHEVFSLGMALAFQVFGDLPSEPHDQPLDGLLTPTGIEVSVN